MSSLYLANGYSENDDQFRFRDYYKSSNGKRKGLKEKMSNETFKKHDKYHNHYIQRIIAISEVIE